MNYLKLFEEYSRYSDKLDISKLSNFDADDMDYFHDMFNDIATEFNIIETDRNAFDESSEFNQYFIGTYRNAYIDLILFTNIGEIIDTLKNNFIPQLKANGWVLAAGNTSFSVEYHRNLNSTEFAEVSICVRKENES